MAAAQAGPGVALQPLDRREPEPDPPARDPHSEPAASPISKPLRLPSERRRGFPSSSPTYTSLQLRSENSVDGRAGSVDMWLPATPNSATRIKWCAGLTHSQDYSVYRAQDIAPSAIAPWLDLS